MTKFNQCPNCHKPAKGGLLGGAYKTIYECCVDKTLYCYECGDKRCPNCGSKDRKEAGRCYARK